MKKILLIPVIVSMIFLQACGQGESAATNKVENIPAKLQIQIPAGADKQDFWQGVAEEYILWRAIGSFKDQEIPLWERSRYEEVDFSRGGKLVFQGRTENGYILVQGGCEIEPWNAENNQQKLIVISVERRGYN